MNKTLPPGFPRLLQDFFCKRLLNQRCVSGQTITAYRDTFRLLLHYLEERCNTKPQDTMLSDLNVDRILAFLDYLEKERGNTARTRNVRLAAIRSFLKYAAACDPNSLGTIQRVLSIPMKRFERPLVGYLSKQEMQAILDAPDVGTFSGRRDRVMFALMYNSGARVSEIAAMKVEDITWGRPASMIIHGKGRKERVVPLWNTTTNQTKLWVQWNKGTSNTSLFPSANGKPITRSGIEYRLRLAVETASDMCASLRHKKVSPHTVRHTTAMHLLQSGVELSVIALWLGHESIATTRMYIEADLGMKQDALDKLQEPHSQKHSRYKPSDKVLQFLESL